MTRRLEYEFPENPCEWSTEDFDRAEAMAERQLGLIPEPARPTMFDLFYASYEEGEAA